MKDLLIKDIQPGEKIIGFFALRKCDLLEKDGRFRLSMELGDLTGRVNAIMWDATKEHASLYQPGVIVKVQGVVSTYMDRLQIRVDRIRQATEEEYDISDFFRRSSKSYEELNGLLDSMLNKIQNTYIKKLLETIFGDEMIRDLYLKAPAAKLLHHDIIGGLAEHSLSMAKVAVKLCDHYTGLDRDMVITGALLHDIGKIWEYEVKASIDFTVAGRLVGHINQGDEYVTGIADSIEHFPDDLLTHIRHLIISHQGTKEHGSPVVPQTPEAMFLHLIDELDSKMGALDKIRTRTDDGDWSEYNRIFERFFYFGYSKQEGTDE